eukprot:gene2521-biopygen11649
MLRARTVLHLEPVTVFPAHRLPKEPLRLPEARAVGVGTAGSAHKLFQVCQLPGIPVQRPLSRVCCGLLRGPLSGSFGLCKNVCCARHGLLGLLSPGIMAPQPPDPAHRAPAAVVCSPTVPLCVLPARPAVLQRERCDGCPSRSGGVVAAAAFPFLAGLAAPHRPITPSPMA